MKKPSASILIIDDEPYIQEVIKRGLNSFDYHFETANHAVEAIEKLRGKSFDLVISDIKMPWGDGIYLLNYIKTNYPDTAVIILTAIYEVQTAIKCLRNGAYNYITKPFEVTTLAFSIKEALEKRRLTLENKEYQRNLEGRLLQQTEHLRQIYLDTVKTIANCLEAKDVYTRGHSKRVTDYALQLAKTTSQSPEFMYQIQLSGLLHDIGKIGISEAILNKSGELTQEEYDQIKLHPNISIHILKPIIHDGEIIDNIQYHHERLDGLGYPNGRKGDAIPLGARILSVADAFDAMTSDRAYRKAMSMEKAISELESNAGTQFDADLIPSFIYILNSVTSLQELWHLSGLIIDNFTQGCIE